MSSRRIAKLLAASAAVLALTAALPATTAFAQSGGGQGSGHGGSGQGASGHGSGQGGQGGQGGSSGARGTPGKGLSGHVFEEDEGPSADAKGPQYGGGRATTGKPPGAGSKQGDLFGDMWVILRDANGVPILSAAGFVQPLDKDGNLIPLDAEGAPLDESLTVAVELGRTNVARSTSKVLDRRLDEVVTAINSASAVSLDGSGRLVVTVDGVPQTIDSPLENLAVYRALITTGSIPGITDPSKLGALSYLADGAKSAADLTAAAGFLAGATDKEAPLSVDEVVYLNQVLGVTGTIVGPDGKTYVDYSSFTYDRQSVYGDQTAQVLLQTSPGVYETTTVNLYEAVFGDKNVTASGAAGFTDAADDDRAVLLYLHDNAPR